MMPAFLMQLILSASFIAVMVGVTALARIPRPSPPLDEVHLRRLLADDYPGQHPQDVWLSADGGAGLAQAGELALFAYRLGDGYVTRDLPWSALARAHRDAGRVIVEFSGPAGGEARLDWPADTAWPPPIAAQSR